MDVRDEIARAVMALPGAVLDERELVARIEDHRDGARDLIARELRRPGPRQQHAERRPAAERGDDDCRQQDEPPARRPPLLCAPQHVLPAEIDFAHVLASISMRSVLRAAFRVAPTVPALMRRALAISA